MIEYPIYLDYNSTTPVDPLVLEAMLPYFSTHFGNAASRNHLYGWVAEEAARILKPSGFLFAYAGVYWKWDVMRLMAEHMDYWFDMALLNTGNSPIMWRKRIISRYKSILVYSKKDESPKARVMSLSFFMCGGQDKRYHTWGQDESSARYYIDCFSKTGDIVLDPFSGGGTTPYVCRVLDRRYLAFELDPKMADVARARVKNVQPVLFDVHEQPPLFSQQKEPQP